MTTPINPTRVYPPGAPYPGGNTPPPPPPPPSGGTYTPPRPPSRTMNAWNRIPQQNPRAQIPGNLPPFLVNRAIVFNTWIIAMITVSFDEWHNLGILPRPARLWDTSLFYGLLVLLGFVDAMVPIVNAFAIGYTLVLLYQYYQGDLTPGGGSTTPAQPGTSGVESQNILPTPTGANTTNNALTGGTG